MSTTTTQGTAPNKRCLKCQPCKDWDKQRAAYAAAISEATPTDRESSRMSESETRAIDSKIMALRSSWNALQEDPDFNCENSND